MAFNYGRPSPFIGGGLSYVSYEETSDHAESGEDVTASGNGPGLLAGIDVQVWRFVHVGGDFRYRRIGGILGEGGVSREFGEDDAGGIAAGLRVSVGR